MAHGCQASWPLSLMAAKPHDCQTGNVPGSETAPPGKPDREALRGRRGQKRPHEGGACEVPPVLLKGGSSRAVREHAADCKCRVLTMHNENNPDFKHPLVRARPGHNHDLYVPCA